MGSVSASLKVGNLDVEHTSGLNFRVYHLLTGVTFWFETLVCNLRAGLTFLC